jgi:hypothetical protein
MAANTKVTLDGIDRNERMIQLREVHNRRHRRLRELRPVHPNQRGLCPAALSKADIFRVRFSAGGSFLEAKSFGDKRNELLFGAADRHRPARHERPMKGVGRRLIGLFLQ